jgi:hypothetical protein
VPLRWLANLFVKASESRNRWSGCRKDAAADGEGSAEYAAGGLGSVGLCAGARRMFFGTSDSGGLMRTSLYRLVRQPRESTLDDNLPMKLRHLRSDEIRVRWIKWDGEQCGSERLEAFAFCGISWWRLPLPLIA